MTLNWQTCIIRSIKRNTHSDVGPEQIQKIGGHLPLVHIEPLRARKSVARIQIEHPRPASLFRRPSRLPHHMDDPSEAPEALLVPIFLFAQPRQLGRLLVARMHVVIVQNQKVQVGPRRLRHEKKRDAEATE